jgi:NAD(P)-dependent dehydrogenase (short-subunit alcohol dehydrogenase family)
MRLLVTGGVGSVGRVAVARLIRKGHTVRVLDREPEAEIEQEVLADIQGAEYRQADITDFGSLAPHFEGMDAVVHLAAIPHPAGGTEPEIWTVNCNGAFNVYRAAADAGIKRVVSASSINALGYNYGIKTFPIEYFPMDEEHPTFTTDPYSFSKRVLEETADYFWRREGISGVCLRLPFVLRVDSRWAGRMKEFHTLRQKAFADLMALPEAERRERIDRLIAESDAERAERYAERPWTERPQRHHSRPDELPPEVMLMWGRDDFWSIIHAEDAAVAIERGIVAEYEGSHPLFVNDAENSVGVPSRDLATLYFPEVKTWTRDVPGTEALVSIARARDLIGFEPENAMRTWTESQE